MYFVPVLLLLLASSLPVISRSVNPLPPVSTQYAGEALKALQRLLNFFESDAQNLNLDGLYGLRIAQGQLDALNQILTSSSKEGAGISDRHHIIQSFIDQIERIANVSLSVIAREQQVYFRHFALVASQPFVIDYQPRRIQRDLIISGPRNSDFDEDHSDQCFAELLGSSDSMNTSKCMIHEPCWKLMTSPRSEDYRLTHQLLWFLIAKRIGCLNTRSLSAAANRNFNNLEDQFCANMYEDAHSNLLRNHNQDLFLEQVLLCSIIGYDEFLRFDWLLTILSWQHPDFDCFSDASERIRFDPTLKRRLLVEQEMNHQCLSHKSGLAAGLLATYARVYLQ